MTRGQNVLYVMPQDWASMTHVVAPLLDRVDEGASEPQLLIITADAEAAAAASASVVRLAGTRNIEALAATSVRRASRMLKLRPAQVIAGTPDELLALVQGTALKLESVRAVVLAWIDELLATAEAPLETLMAEISKDAARVIVTNEASPAVDALVERYARRARRVAPVTTDADTPTAIGYLTVSAEGRRTALRRVLDALDPAKGLVYVRSDESEAEARGVLRALGYGDTAERAIVRVARGGGAEGVELVVLYDVPASREELREAIGAQPRRIVALAQPRQLTGLRTLTAGGTVTPLTLPEAGTAARARETALRAELRETLVAGSFSRELLSLEPLLDEFDGIEIAAAALRLLEHARQERDAVRARPVEARGPGATGVAMTRLFINVGSMDNTRTGDLVGAITHEAGITSAQLGKIDVREKHAIVEVASDVAETVVTKVTGSTIRGRRVLVRVDQERPRDGVGGASRARGGGDRERGGRGERERGRGRGERPDRGGRVDRGDRAGRGDAGGRGGTGRPRRQGSDAGARSQSAREPLERAARPQGDAE